MNCARCGGRSPDRAKFSIERDAKVVEAGDPLRARGLSHFAASPRTSLPSTYSSTPSPARSRTPVVHEVAVELARVLGDDATREHELREVHRLSTETGATEHAERTARELRP